MYISIKNQQTTITNQMFKVISEISDIQREAFITKAINRFEDGHISGFSDGK